MAMNSDPLERYVVRGDAVHRSELETNVKCVKDTVEAAFAGLLEVKYNKKSKLEEVVLPHRSAKDFLLDTVEGQNLWQPCDIPREELCARHFKSLLADGRLYSENPDYSLTQGVDIRNLLSDMFRWHGEQGFHLEMINTFFELARVCRLRGHVHPILQKYPDLQLRRIKGQYPLHVAAGGDIQHFHYLLQKYEISKEESIYCQFFNLCNFSSFKSTEIRLIERILVNGYSPNWNAVNTPTTTGNRLIASPWFNFLITLLDKPCIFFPGTSRSDLRPLFSDVIQMFLKAGASLESRFPVVIRVELFGNDSITIGWANQLTSSPTSFLPQYVLFEMNGKAAVDFVTGHYYDPEPKVSSAIQSICSTAKPYVKALAFTNRKDLLLSLIWNEGFSRLFVERLEWLYAPVNTGEGFDKKQLAALFFSNTMTSLKAVCPLAKGGYHWRGVPIKVSDN